MLAVSAASMEVLMSDSEILEESEVLLRMHEDKNGNDADSEIAEKW